MLADVLPYTRQLGATHLIDFATLTGAMERALGDFYAGVFANDSEWRTLVIESGEASGDHAWPWPLHSRYRRFIDETLCPFVELPDVAVLGINTARSLTFKDGRINKQQVEFIRETFARVASDKMRVIVTHHPLFALEVGGEVERAIGRQELALDAVEESGVDIVLAGHNHHASSQDASDLVTRAGGVLVVQAGTATSTRVREQEQSFNTIDLVDSSATITVHAWNGDEFKANDARRYRWQDGRWRILKSMEPAH